MLNDISGFDAVNEMYLKMYKGQIFNRKTSFAVKWNAIRSLWIMHKLR
jgi:hypothetical protein